MQYIIYTVIMNGPSWAVLRSISPLPFAIMDFFRKILRSLEIQSQHVFFEAVHIEVQDCYYGKN